MLAVWLALGAAPQVQACDGAQLADAAGAAFLSAAKQGSVAAFASALASYADMDKITLFALGRYQNQLHPTRRAELIQHVIRAVEERGADIGMDDISAVSGVATRSPC